MARLVSLSFVILLLVLDVVIAFNAAKKINDEMEYETFKRRYAICHLPVQRGNCRQRVNAWYFNPAIKGCEKFTYRLCKGNANRFYTEKECMDFCNDYKYTLEKRIPESREFEPQYLEGF